MEEKEVILTQEGYDKIEKELEKNDKLKNVIKDLKNNLS